MMLISMMRFGTDSAAGDFDDRTGFRGKMMGWAGNQNAVWLNDLLGLITWILIIAVLAALLRVLWKKGDKIK